MSKIRDAFLNITVIVVGLGYFVDIFDLTLFNMVRRQSLLDIGVLEHELVSKGLFLLNVQMIGMLIGGILWGQLGDRKGRLSTLFGSIVMYSVANIFNVFVQNFDQYAILRFIAGVGLAGELGVGITLVSELLPKETRGLGTMFVATIGVFGAVLGGVCVEFFSWRTCYAFGGGLGFALLLLRVSIKESEIFKTLKMKVGVRRGHFLDLFRDAERLKRFCLCIMIGIPFWYIAGIIMPFTPELAQNLHVTEPILSSRSVAISYLGLAVGDFLSGWVSQLLQSRRKALFIFHFSCTILILVLFFTVGGRGSNYFYFLCFLIGVAAGFWALFVTVAAESFGTNIRSTAATAVPNFVRAAVVPMTLLLIPLRSYFLYENAVLIVGAVCFAIATAGIFLIQETFGRSLDFVEEIQESGA